MKRIAVILDFSLCVLLGALSLAALTALFFVMWLSAVFFKKRQEKIRGKRILQFAHYNINDIEGSSGPHVVFQSNLGGYLEKVVTVLFSDFKVLYSDQSYGPSHRILHVPQKPKCTLKRIGLKRLLFAISMMRLLPLSVILVRQEKIGLIRAQDPHLFGLVALLTSLYTGVPYTIHVIQNYDISTRRIRRLVFAPFLFKAIERQVEGSVFKGAFFTTSSYANYKFYALSHGARPETAFSLRTCVGACHFTEPALRKNIKADRGLSDKKVVLYVGRLEKVKFVEDAITSFALIAENVPDAALLIAGRGSLKAALEERAKELGLGERIIFLGHVAENALADLYYSADAILFTHAGMTLVEAALSSKPIACYDHDWAGEFIGYNERGLLAQFRNTSELAGKVIALLQDKGLSSRLGGSARDFAKRYFHESVIRGLEVSVLNRFMGTP